MNKNSDMTFIDHLEELRWRMLKSLGSILVMSIFAFIFADDFVAVLIDPAVNIKIDLQTLTPQGMFMLKWKLAIIGGFILSIPVLTVQIWKFVSPGLYNKERKIVLPLIITVFLCFILGAIFAYMVILPFSLNFLASMVTDGIVNNFSINDYFGFILALIIGSGLIFEMPVASFLFSSIGIITPSFLRRFRREAIMVTVILSAIVTPPDPISLIIMSIPMVILYEISILVSWISNRLFNQDE